jgi:hypothetical protein
VRTLSLGFRAPPPRHARPPQACVLLRCRLRPYLRRLRPVDLLEVLPWKSTSPFLMPCQPIVLMGDKT